MVMLIIYFLNWATLTQAASAETCSTRAVCVSTSLWAFWCSKTCSVVARLRNTWLVTELHESEEGKNWNNNKKNRFNLLFSVTFWIILEKKWLLVTLIFHKPIFPLQWLQTIHDQQKNLEMTIANLTTHHSISYILAWRRFVHQSKNQKVQSRKLHQRQGSI